MTKKITKIAHNRVFENGSQIKNHKNWVVHYSDNSTITVQMSLIDNVLNIIPQLQQDNLQDNQQDNAQDNPDIQQLTTFINILTINSKTYNRTYDINIFHDCSEGEYIVSNQL